MNKVMQNIKGMAHTLAWEEWKNLPESNNGTKIDPQALNRFQEKFAKLIVQECLQKCQDEYDEFKESAANNDGSRQSDFAFGSVNSAERIADAIKRQFGIE